MLRAVTVDVRPTRPEEFRAVHETIAAALMFPPPTDAEWPTREEGWRSSDTISAWEGGRCVGHAGAFRFDTLVPGGARLDTAGVTRIGVLPSHTRRGLLTEMMRELLAAARGRGASLASLRASEAVIYRRFGFGVAAEAAGVVVRPREAGPVAGAAPGRVRLLRADEVMDVVPPLYDRIRRRVGTLSRPEFLWRGVLRDAVEQQKAAFVAVHEGRAGDPDGYVAYDLAWRPAAHPIRERGGGNVYDLIGADDAVELALWRHLLEIDLVHEWSVRERPVDDPVRFAVANARAYEATPWDEQWVRLLDVERALGSRTYAPAHGRVVVEVHDPVFPANDGAFAVEAAGAARVEDEPDLVATIDGLSAAYLGGTSWRELAAAGRVEARRSGAIEVADVLFAQRPAPFSGTFF